jgi:hypothetical protein
MVPALSWIASRWASVDWSGPDGDDVDLHQLVVPLVHPVDGEHRGSAPGAWL